MSGELGLALTRLAQLRMRALMSISAQVVTGSIAVLSTSLSFTLILSDLFAAHLSTALHTAFMMVTLNGLLIILLGGLIALTLLIRRWFTLPRVAEQIERALEARELMPDVSRGVISTLTLTLESRHDHRVPNPKMSALLARRAIPVFNLADRELFVTPWRILTLILIYSGALSTHWLARAPELAPYLLIAPNLANHGALKDELGSLGREQRTPRGAPGILASTDTPPITFQETLAETLQTESDAPRDQLDRTDIAQARDQMRGRANQKRSQQSTTPKRSRKPLWGSRDEQRNANSLQRAEPRRARERRMSIGGQRTREGQRVGARALNATRSVTLTPRDARQGNSSSEEPTQDNSARDSRGAQVMISERESASIYGVAPQLTLADFPPELSDYINARAGEAP